MDFITISANRWILGGAFWLHFMYVFFPYDLKGCLKCWVKTGANFARGMLSLVWWRQICSTYFHNPWVSCSHSPWAGISRENPLMGRNTHKGGSHGSAWKHTGFQELRILQDKVLYLYTEVFLDGRLKQTLLIQLSAVLPQSRPSAKPHRVRG